MRTLDLRRESITVGELLQWARSDTVLIRAENGQEFVLEEADEFDREVALLGGSERFMSFLEERGREPATIPIEEIEKTLDTSTPDTPPQGTLTRSA